MDKEYMDEAFKEAEKSTCLRAHVGVVFVLNNTIIAKGYNNVSGGVADCTKFGCIRDMMHIPSGERREVCRYICAEQVAITESAKMGVKLDGSTVYVTTFPCHICAKMLVNCGVKEIVYDKDYPDILSHGFLKEAGITVRKI